MDAHQHPRLGHSRSADEQVIPPSPAPDLPSDKKSKTLSKIGDVLESDDLALHNFNERTLVIPVLSEIYGIQFSDDTVDRSASPSATSKKAVIHDADGNRYFLKQKAFYCDNPESLRVAAAVQTFLSEKLSEVPPIVQTAKGSFYSHFGERVYQLTPYYEGQHYTGSVNQSIASARQLAVLHKAAADLSLEPSRSISSEAEALKFVDWIRNRKDLPQPGLVAQVTTRLEEEIRRLNTGSSHGRNAWLHGDYAPFNLVFEGNNVIGINDFDNCGFGPIARDVAYCLLTHCGIYFLANTSSFNRPILTNLDTPRMKAMLEEYVSVNPLSHEDLNELGAQVAVQWLELLGLGILRGDYYLEEAMDVATTAAEFKTQVDSMIEETGLGKSFTSAEQNQLQFDRALYETKWRSQLAEAFPGSERQLEDFFKDRDKGFEHSWQVLLRSHEIIETASDVIDRSSINIAAVEQLAMFHDLGKYFQEVQSFENLRVSQGLYRQFAQFHKVDPAIESIVFDGIPGTDFYSRRLNPNEEGPSYLEGDIVRAADKTLDNLVGKVDRYWYEYGVPRGATFYDPTLSFDDRKAFSFGNFSGDQMNVILTIIALRPQDFLSPRVGQVYGAWAESKKELVVKRIIEVAETVAPTHVADIKDLIVRYRSEFSC
jgi:Ser/Thr protein kinase RdoA (MazF antagonist)